jgi:hypothetical protein
MVSLAVTALAGLSLIVAPSAEAHHRPGVEPNPGRGIPARIYDVRVQPEKFCAYKSAVARHVVVRWNEIADGPVRIKVLRLDSGGHSKVVRRFTFRRGYQGNGKADGDHVRLPAQGLAPGRYAVELRVHPVADGARRSHPGSTRFTIEHCDAAADGLTG